MELELKFNYYDRHINITALTIDFLLDDRKIGMFSIFTLTQHKKLSKFIKKVLEDEQCIFLIQSEDNTVDTYIEYSEGTLTFSTRNFDSLFNIDVLITEYILDDFEKLRTYLKRDIEYRIAYVKEEFSNELREELKIKHPTLSDEDIEHCIEEKWLISHKNLNRKSL